MIAAFFAVRASVTGLGCYLGRATTWEATRAMEGAMESRINPPRQARHDKALQLPRGQLRQGALTNSHLTCVLGEISVISGALSENTS